MKTTKFDLLVDLNVSFPPQVFHETEENIEASLSFFIGRTIPMVMHPDIFLIEHQKFFFLHILRKIAMSKIESSF